MSCSLSRYTAAFSARLAVLLGFAMWLPLVVRAEESPKRFNVLFIISDDLTDTALSCYGNQVCQTPNIDGLAKQGTRFTRAYCQATYCGPSRASMLSGYYPHATGVLGYVSGRKAIGDRETWPQRFKNQGYRSVRVSKIFHMGVPGGVEKGGHGSDDARSWSERYNSQGPEWRAPGKGETLEGNPDGKKSVVGGNTFVVVEAEGDDLVHSDGKTARKAVEILEQYGAAKLADRKSKEPLFLAVGFVRPHVPFVAPKRYFAPFPPEKMVLPKKVPGDWDDIPRAGINYKTSKNMKMNLEKQRKAVSGYYASVAFLDAQVGKVLEALERSGLADDTIVIFTSDHGYHLGEHDFWAKVSLLDESARVPLIIKVRARSPPCAIHSSSCSTSSRPSRSSAGSRSRSGFRAATSRLSSTIRSSRSATPRSVSTARASSCGRRAGRTSSTAKRPSGACSSTI